MTTLALLAFIGCPAPEDTATEDTAFAEPDPEPALEGTFETTNSAGRTGSYYLPEGWNLGPLPVLVGYHGTGGDGAQQVVQFRQLAAEQSFAIVAPDSRQSPSGEWTWEGGDAGEVTEDMLHTLALLDEAEALGLDIDEGRVLGTGFSGGASSAPYMATNDDRFIAYASLHGGVFPTGMGDNRTAGWFSTGEDDTLRTPEEIYGHAEAVEAAGYPAPEVRIYPGGHGVSAQEASELVDWWLALGD